MYSFKEIEEKWQKKWEEKQVFKVREDKKKKKYYVLEQFPYPSSTGLHTGHSFIYTIGDIYARFKRMNGYNVLYPMGYDSLGLPAENAAIKAKIHPRKYTEDSIKNFVKQQKHLGLSYDWHRMIKTHDPSYYKWDQWIFLEMFKKNLAYKKESPVNYCSKCKTVLANEQVHDGKCWRHEDTDVEIRHLSQWYLKITDYAEELNKGLDKLDGWPDLIKNLQKNWIGKSYGTEIKFKINGKDWKIFTTRPDTLYGVTFMVVSAQHTKLRELVTYDRKEEVNKFVKKLSSVSQENIDQLEKEGVFTGSYAIHPLTMEKIPVYAGNFVLADYGSGMVMAVPGHDQRDFEFAKKYNLPIKEVIKGGDIKKEAYTEEGILVNSDKFNGINNKKAIEEITNYLKKENLGKEAVNFRLKDWLISRQRYWGTPIPIVYCDRCGFVPVKNLPVKLPEKVKFGEGNPLETNKDFVNTKCPRCKGKAKRETDTMDTFVNSSWYYLRYCDINNNKNIFDKKKVDYWCPIDMYIGGKEHACMHLIYIRFYTKFLRDLGLLKIDEPAINLFVQGMLHGEDGNKMSKSLGNIIDPLDMINRYGADSLRLFLVSVASPSSDFNWNDKSLESSFRFVNKVYDYFNKVKIGKSSKKIESKINRSIKEITEDIKNFRYNLAIIKLRDLLDKFEDEINKKDAESFLKLFSVFCPHLAEELWSKYNRSFISLESWPKFDEKLIDEKLEILESSFEKLISDIRSIIKMIGVKPKEILLIVGYSGMYKKEKIKQEQEINFLNDSKNILEKEFNCKFIISRAEESKEEKAKKAKPLKPAIVIK